MFKERDAILSFQKTRMEELENISLSEGGAESDALIEALRRSMVEEFERQRQAQVSSFTAELSIQMGQFNSPWEVKMETVCKNDQMNEHRC